MKKLTYILNSFVFLLFLSCGQNSSEKKLNGKWYGINNNGRTIMHFHPDSLVFTEEYSESVEWKATKSKISFSLPSNLWLDSVKEVTVNYRLSNNGDTLFSTFKSIRGENDFNLLKAKNYIEYLNKRYKIEFSLPEDDSVPPIKTNATYGLKVFIGYENNKIVRKTEFSNHLNKFEIDINTFKDSIKPNTQHLIETHKKTLHRRFHLRVFADKKIADSTITKLLPVTVINKLDSINKYIPKVYK